MPTVTGAICQVYGQSRQKDKKPEGAVHERHEEGTKTGSLTGFIFVLFASSVDKTLSYCGYSASRLRAARYSAFSFSTTSATLST
jgi:hypothetical protein